MTNEGDPKLKSAFTFISWAQARNESRGRVMNPQPKPPIHEPSQRSRVSDQLKDILEGLAASEGEVWAEEMALARLTSQQRELASTPHPNYKRLDEVREQTVATFRPNELIEALTADLIELGTPPENAPKTAQFAHDLHLHPWMVKRRVS